MKYLIVANGIVKNDNRLLRYIRQADVVVCADGGAGHIKRMNLVPDIVIGDLDSIEDEVKHYINSYIIQNRVALIKYPTKKNASDTELAVLWAIDQGATDITLAGVTGTRMDHTLSNIFLLHTIAQRGIECRIVDDHNEIYLLSHCVAGHESVDEQESLSRMDVSAISVTGEPGGLLSIIPVTQMVTGLTLKGLEYPLDNADLTFGSSRGISNVFNENVAHISLKQGIMLVIKSSD
ncbi:MAG: thiamine diphosphokinase [Desulfamplus sp.]|nr:thiamine diphosphokinase [Desulfamplus sp.]